MRRTASALSLRIALIVSLGGFLFGFDASVISGVTRFVQPQFGLTDAQVGWLVSSPSIAAMLSMLAAGAVTQRWGRKPVLYVVAILYMVSAISSAVAPDYTFLVVSRMMGGLAFGAALVLAPMYIAEIAPAATRGRLISVQQLNIVLGFSTAYFSNYFLMQGMTEWGWASEATVWRWMFFVEFVPSLLFLGLLRFIPRSPRWLYLAGQEAEAVRTLEDLYGTEEAAGMLEQIRTAVAEKLKTPRARYRDLLSPSISAVFWLALLVGVLQQATGVNAIFFYATTIFERSGIGANASFAQAVMVGIINVVFTIIAIVVIDRLGRRPLLLAGLLGIAISMGITGWGFQAATYSITAERVAVVAEIHPDADLSGLAMLEGETFDSEVSFRHAAEAALGQDAFTEVQLAVIEQAITMPSILILFGILGFVASFAVSLGPVTWVLLSELFPQRLRAIGISVVGFVNSLVSWLVQFMFPLELDWIGSSGTYLLYGAIALIGGMVLMRRLPETKGKSLEEIQKSLLDPTVAS